MIPELNKEYHIFDDGKIKPSRHYIAKIVELISFNKCEDSELIKAWYREVADCAGLYSTDTDYFVKAVSDYDREPLYFVRTQDGGWFFYQLP